MTDEPEPPAPDPAPEPGEMEPEPARPDAVAQASTERASAGVVWNRQLDGEAERALRPSNVTNNITNEIHGGVHGAAIALGTAALPPPGRMFNAALSEFDTVSSRKAVYETLALKEAQRRLGRDRLLVLVAPSDSGKDFAALCLLGRQGHRKALGIRPAAGPEEIAVSLTEDDAAYVIRGSEMLGPAAAGPSVPHDWDVLANQLRKMDSYLVATVHTETALAGRVPYGYAWTRPDPPGLFRHLWQNGAPCDPAPDPDDIDKLVKDLTDEGLLTPTLTVRLVTVLQGGADPATAYETIRESSGAAAKAAVEQWSAATQPFDHVLYLTVVAFLGGLDESTLERRFDELRERFEPPSGDLDLHDAPPEAENDEPPARAPRPSPSRQKRVKTDLLRVATPSGTLMPDRTVDLVGEPHRQAVLQEIWTCWGRDFWDPVIAWLASLPKGLGFDGADRLALGLASLATCSYSEVRQMLRHWWDGSAEERRCAVQTVSRLAGDSRLGPAALHTTIVLGRRPDASRESWWTTDIALGGPLGVAFWPVAVPELWSRVRATDPRGPAGLALWNLLAGAEASDELAAIILSFLCRQFEQAEDDARRRAVLANAVAVLGTRFERDDKVARSAVFVSGLKEPRRYFVALLRMAILSHPKATRPLVMGMVRHAQAVGAQDETLSLLQEAAASQDPVRTERLHWALGPMVEAALKGQDLDDEDAVRWRAFSAGPARPTDDTKGGLDGE